ncbi:MAG: kinase [Novosphingobium sp.]|nr:kinase [Novosphingobium sp.]
MLQTMRLPDMTPDFQVIIEAERLPAAYKDTVARWWRPLAIRIAEWRTIAGRPLVIGINGAQGSGKSTLCRFLEGALLPQLGLAAVTVSLDDLYLTRVERADLARTIHPLLATRGVPGTHDVALGQSVLDELLARRTASIPRFSKALDDRLPPDQARHVRARADVILFEGWCVGATPQQPSELAVPVNALEADHDPKGIWRKYVNDQLAGPYAAWFSRIDHLVMLQAPTFESVLRNRIKQEHKLRSATPDAPAAMDDAQVARFISHYERVTKHMIAIMGTSADVCFALDDQQQVVGVTAGTPRSG